MSSLKKVVFGGHHEEVDEPKKLGSKKQVSSGAGVKLELQNNLHQHQIKSYSIGYNYS